MNLVDGRTLGLWFDLPRKRRSTKYFGVHWTGVDNWAGVCYASTMATGGVKIGERYSSLVVQEFVEPYMYKGKPRSPRVRCICDCGNMHVARCDNLRSKQVMSCGCGQAQWGPTMPLQERFDQYVDKKNEKGCWLWLGNKNEDGYGQFKLNERNVRAHRLAFTLSGGSIPVGYSVCHACDTPACVNPAHLFVGTQTDNMRDMWRKGRQNTTKRKRNADGTFARGS